MAYRTGYLAARRAMDGAIELLTAVRTRTRIGIVSNNLLDEQVEKLQYCRMDPFIDVLVVSEEAGISKPDPGIFQIALDRLGIRADETVMVGDSWANDIVGARRAGIRGVWFNPRRLAKPEADAAVGEINALTPVDAVMPILFGSERPVRE
jgi:putative hydrolase of the HAD superfamily